MRNHVVSQLDSIAVPHFVVLTLADVAPGVALAVAATGFVLCVAQPPYPLRAVVVHVADIFGAVGILDICEVFQFIKSIESDPIDL